MSHPVWPASQLSGAQARPHQATRTAGRAGQFRSPWSKTHTVERYQGLEQRAQNLLKLRASSTRSGSSVSRHDIPISPMRATHSEMPQVGGVHGPRPTDASYGHLAGTPCLDGSNRTSVESRTVPMPSRRKPVLTERFNRDLLGWRASRAHRTRRQGSCSGGGELCRATEHVGSGSERGRHVGLGIQALRLFTLATMMNPARSMWGCTSPSLARLPMDCTPVSGTYVASGLRARRWIALGRASPFSSSPCSERSRSAKSRPSPTTQATSKGARRRGA